LKNKSINVNSLKPENFKEEMFSRSCDTLVEVMAARADLSTYWIFWKSERTKKPELKKDFKERPHYVAAANKNISPKTFSGSSPVSSSYFKSSKDFKEEYLIDIECLKCHK